MKDRIETYAKETAVLLQTLHQTLENDERIVAAWLFGSKGRGGSDALSDLDLWLIMADGAFEELVADKLAFVSDLGELVFHLEAPQNAPVGGAYLAVQFDAPTAPHHVDFYWQPQAIAVRPPETTLLFDKVGIERVDTAVPNIGGQTPAELDNDPMHYIRYFWMMVMVSAKQSWRQPELEEIPYLPYFLPTLHMAQRLANLPEMEMETAVPRTKAAKLEKLYQIADAMKRTMQVLENRGTAVPHNVVPGIYRFLEMVVG